MKMRTKKNSIKKLMNNSISLVLAFMLIFGLTLPAAAQEELAAPSETAKTAVQLSDITGNWAASTINEWVNKGLAQGYEDGTFRPDNDISRAEFIALTNQAFGFTDIVPVSYTDVSGDDWFITEIGRAQAAAYISGYGDGTIRPYGPISRQEAAVMITRIAQLNIPADTSQSDEFIDAADFPAWSKGAIAAVAAKGIMQGYPDQSFQACRNISRAEAIVTLNNVITIPVPAETGRVYDKAGTYGDAGKQEVINGDVTISVAGVTLQNLKINGNLVLSEDIAEGDVVLKKIEVQGNSTIKGGGANSVKLEDCILPRVTINKEGVRVVASGKTAVPIVVLQSGATLVQTTISGPGFETVTIAEAVAEGAKISLDGNFNQVKVAAAKVNVVLREGSISKLEVTEKAAGAKLELPSGTKVGTLTLNAIISVLGQATIQNTVQNVTGSSFDKGINLETTSRGSGTGGGDGNNPLNLVSSIPADGSTGVSNSPAIVMVFDRGVVRDNWENNQNCFSLAGSSGSTVGITVSRAGNYLDDSEKRTIYITPNSSLAAGETYTLTVSAGLKANNGNTLGTARSISFTVAGSTGGDSGPARPAAPTLDSASTNNEGTKIKLVFNKAMADPKEKHGEFSVSVNGVDNPVTAAAADKNNDKGINLSLSTPVTGGETITVSYTRGSLLAVDGGVLANFTAQSVVNTLTPAAPAAPILDSASTNNEGTKIKLVFTKAMADPKEKHGEFSVSVNGVDNPVTAAAADKNNDKGINLTLKTAVESGDTITVAYTEGSILSADGEALASFTAQSVVNTLTPAAPAAPALVKAEVTNKGDISILFNQVIEDPAGKQAQFTVTVDDNDNAVTEVGLTNTDGKIKLTLTDRITTTGHNITVSYTKGSDGASQVKSTDGGILESFTESFTN